MKAALLPAAGCQRLANAVRRTRSLPAPLLAFAIAAFFATSLLSAPQVAQRATLLPPAAKAAIDSINGEHIRAQVKFLSNDLLEGRGTGQRGGDIAAEYIATQFALDALQPAGDNGGYLQKVPLVGIKTEPQTTIAFASENSTTTPLRLGEDIVAMDESQNQESEVDAPIVFVGYGIEAPEYKWNDFKDADVRGKVLLCLVNQPPSNDPNFFTGKALTYYGRWTYKFEEAARKGAAGVLLIHKTEMASYGWNVVQTSWGSERSYLREDRKPHLKIASWITYDTANQIAASVGLDAEKMILKAQSRDFKPMPLPLRLRAHMVSAVREFDSENVVALLPGADPRMRDHAVLYTAHFDHLGIHPGQPGDNIYNGAIDNGTGCGMILEMARAYTQAARPPRRSIIFALVTAEEQGLRGSEWLAGHTPVPVNNINLALNYDAIAPIGVPEEVEVTGAERTTFYPEVESTAGEFHLSIQPDSEPGAGHFYRSDHFSLAHAGVPAFSINQGTKFAGHPRQWGEDWQKDYVAHHYHQPSDEYHVDWDFRGNAKLAQFGMALGWKAADTSQEIAWRSGDEFAAARKPAR